MPSARARLSLVVRRPLDGTAALTLEALARAARLRRDVGVDYAGAVLASELLARIEALEGRLLRYEASTTRPSPRSSSSYGGGGGGMSLRVPRTSR
jgi:hypothetical protein